MQKRHIFRVTVHVTVPAYGEYTVEADTREEAQALVEKEIEEHGWGAKAWQYPCFDVSWEDAEGLGVVLGSAREVES